MAKIEISERTLYTVQNISLDEDYTRQCAGCSKYKDITDEAESSQHKLPLSEPVKLACPGGAPSAII